MARWHRGTRNNNWKFTIIADNRFPDEVESVLNQRYGFVIRLTRNPFDDKHTSETALDDYDWGQHKCFVINNSSMSIEDQKNAIIPIMNDILSEQGYKLHLRGKFEKSST